MGSVFRPYVRELKGFTTTRWLLFLLSDECLVQTFKKKFVNPCNTHDVLNVLQVTKTSRIDTSSSIQEADSSRSPPFEEVKLI